MTISKILNYIALILGFLSTAFFVIFLIVDAISYLFGGKISVIPILILMVLASGGYLLEIVKPGKGSLFMISGGLVMSVYLIIIGGMGEIEMALIYGLPFIIPGTIFYFTGKRQT